MSKDAGIEPRTVTTFALAVRRSNYSARSRRVVVDEIYPSFKTLWFCIFFIKSGSVIFLTRNTGIVQGEELSLEEKKERAKQVTLTRILTDEDFKKIGRESKIPDSFLSLQDPDPYLFVLIRILPSLSKRVRKM